MIFRDIDRKITQKNLNWQDKRKSPQKYEENVRTLKFNETKFW